MKREFLSINFTTYYTTACVSVNKIEELNKFFIEKDNITFKDEDTIRGIHDETQRLCVTTIIFCTMTLESFINHYGSTKLSKTYFENYLDKLDLKSKWILIPKLITGNQINTNGKAFMLLSNLMTLRNKLVHDKVKIKKDTVSIEENFLWEKDANESLECVKLMIVELKKIDTSIYSDWII